MPRRQHHQESYAGKLTNRITTDDDDVPILGADLAPEPEHVAELLVTESHFKSEKTLRDHRNRIKHMYEWLEKHYPDYAAVGVRTLTEAERLDPKLYHHRNSKDLVYTGLNVEIIKYFLIDKKKKANGKISSFPQLRKYHDAILFGSTVANEPLPQQYYLQMSLFLNSFKKETRKAKQDGNLDEEESDPIPYGLYCIMNELAILMGMVFVWCFSVAQWNCLARSISIDPLALHHFTPGSDSLKITFDQTKADKSGSRVAPKNIFANPFDPRVSFHLAMGCWFCLSKERFLDSEKIFLNKNAKEGTAATSYCQQLSKLLKANIEKVREFVRPDHCNSHGIRKGGAVHCTTATTAPPPIPSVVGRGDWSLSQVLDIYLTFGDPGDCYVGRILAGLSPDDPNFCAMPPHFGEAGIENDAIKEALYLCFRPIIDNHPGIVWLLLLLLASIVYHANFLKSVIAVVENHPFTGIALLQRPELLEQLMALVTIEPSSKIPQASGVPPHVKELTLLRKLLNVVTIQTLVKDFIATVKQSVRDGINDVSARAGQITVDSLHSMLETFHHKIVTEIDEKIQLIAREGNQYSSKGKSADNPRALQPANDSNCFGYARYCYKGKFWDVPENFTLPSNLTRRQAWDLWLVGEPSRKVISAITGEEFIEVQVMPYRFFHPPCLPSKVSTAFKSSWRPVLSIMSDGLNISTDAQKITEAIAEELFQAGTQNLQKHAPYVWRQNLQHENWSVSYWSKKIRRNQLEKFASGDERNMIGEKTRFNRAHAPGRKKRRPNPPKNGLSKSQRASVLLRKVLPPVDQNDPMDLQEETLQGQQLPTTNKTNFIDPENIINVGDCNHTMMVEPDAPD